jgi:transposase InsO family protein
VWFQSRHGKVAAMNTLMPQAVRREVSRSNALWSHDGTPVQLYYIDDDGSIRSSLYLYVVTDAHSRAIIGHSLGHLENYRIVVGSLSDAIERTGYVPDQLQYDNGSSSNCDAVQAFQNNMSMVHFPCQPRRARPKYVESILGMFQTLVLRQESNFKGANITARSLDNRTNPEHMEFLKKNKHLLPSFSQIKEQVTALIEKYNNLATGRDEFGRRIGESPMSKYNSALEGSRKLNYFEKLSLFVVSVAKPYKYGVRGIERKIDGQKYYYIVPDDENNTTDFKFQRLHAGESFTIKINLENPDFIMLFDSQDRFVAQARDREKLAPCIADYKEGEGAKVRRFINGTKQWAEENENRYRELLRPTGTDGFVNVELMDKESYNRMESQAIDQINGIQEESELVQRLKSTWK